MSTAALGMRPLAIGVLAGGLTGSTLALPALHHQLSGNARGGAVLNQRARRGAGLLANFVVPSTFVVASGHHGIGASMRIGLVTAAAAVTGAYWGTHLLGSA